VGDADGGGAPEATVSSLADFTADSVGSAMVRSSTAGWTPADGGPKLSMVESSAEGRSFPAAVA